MHQMRVCLFLMLAIAVGTSAAVAQDAKAKPKPLKALLITGGCCHEYGKQKDLLKKGIEARAMVEVSHVHSTDTTTKARFSIYEDPDWAKGYDIILHDECTSDVIEQPYVDNILNAHKNGLPAVNLHCAMHSYRLPGKDDWFQFVGIQSNAHGPQKPIEISFVERDNPIIKPLDNWTTVNEELYNNIKLFPDAKPLAHGRQDVNGKTVDYVVVWTNTYGKGRVFSTTLGHNTETVGDARYLDLVTRGLLWACDKLNPEYLQPFAVAKKQQVPVNIAAGKPSKASASQNGHPPEHALDGKADTRWCSPDDKPGQWWQVDLGQPEQLTGCQIVWEQDGINYRYKIEGSENGEKWRMLSDQTKTDDRDQTQRLKFDAQAVRFVRLTTTQLTPGCWGSFSEFEVHGTKTEERTAISDASLRPRNVKDLPGVKVPAGFEAVVFAAPPNVNYPTCVATTPDGVVYVGVDENGSLDKQPNRGRIVRCRDTDGDGRADEFKTFAKMDSPRGIVVMTEKQKPATSDPPTVRTSLIVLHPPTLSVFHDQDGDGVSDKSEVLVNGIGFDLKSRGADHTTNGIQVGIDGWIYVAVGDYGFVNAVGTDGHAVQLRGGGIARVRADGSELEIVSRGQRNIYDVAISPTMDLFTRDNTNDGGGWNVRLSHVPQDAQMGYPTLFVNFPEEIVQPLADYGGGSPCGALFIDEPTLPGELGHQLYTCDWGRSVIYRHPLTHNGASFIAEQEPFIEVPRPTDMDVDLQGNIYITSWKDGGFTFSGQNVGYVIKVKPLSLNPESLSTTSTENAARAGSVVQGSRSDDSELVNRIASPSHTIRLNAQREILRHGDNPAMATGLENLARSNEASLPVRVAAVLTLKQLRGEKSHPFLVDLSKVPVMREYALRAIADRKSQLAPQDLSVFVDALDDSNPRVRVAAARAIGRFANTGAANSSEMQSATERLVFLTADPDPIVVHVAIHSLIELRAIEACVAALNTKRLGVRVGATMVLLQLHDPATVRGLLSWLEHRQIEKPVTDSDQISLNRASQSAVLAALCRLHSREADWMGDWWSTRPDTSGPYYKPVAWSETDGIRAILEFELKAADETTAMKLLVEMKRNKIELSNSQTQILKLAAVHREFFPTAIELLAAMVSPLSQESAQLLGTAATADDSSPAVRAKALRALLKRIGTPAIADIALRSFAEIDEQRQQGDVAAVWDEFIHDPKLAQFLPAFVKLANLEADVSSQAAPQVQQLAYAVLISIADNPRLEKADRDAALRAVEQAWTDPRDTINLLRAIGRSRAESQAMQVRALRKSDQTEIRSAAEFAAMKLELDHEPAFDPKKPLIASLKYEDVVRDAVNFKGDPTLGARVFTRQGCSACHTVSPNEPLKGPLLQDITKRYKKEDLVEAILKPSAKIAQGFESQFFVTDSGKVYEGFVVRESGDDVEFRNVAGLSMTLRKSEIEERGRRETSMMPLGLVDKLNVDQLAAILAYLDSLRKK